MSEMIDQYLDELETSKEDIKQSLINKGVTPTGGLTSYAEAVDSIKSNLGTATVSITKNGTQTITAEEYGYDGMSKVDVTVKVATGGSDKPQIFNGFQFTGGDIAQVDFSQYDWSMVYDTSKFFSGCTHSTGDWSNFEENFNGEVLSGSYMFSECGSLSTIPQMDTSKVIDMSYMFGWCNSLISIPQLDTSKVTNMNAMFGFCSSLTTIPNFNTSNVTNMVTMFNGCSSLTSIPQLDTSNVTSMGAMFKGCSRLTSIPQLDTSNVENMDSMFQNCTNLTTIPQLDTSNVTSMNHMFNGCSSLTSIPQLDTSNVENIISMFNGCKQLTTIPQLDTSKATNMDGMFYGCKQLTTIPQLDTSNVTKMSYMFNNCNNLIELPDFNCVKVTDFGGSSYNTWLYNCYNLKKIGVVDCDSVAYIQYFFGNITLNSLTDFGGCRNLGKASSVSNTNSNYFMNYAPNLTYESVMNVINGLYDRAGAGLSVLTLKLHANHLAMLSEDDIAIATNKGWTIV